MADQQAQAAAPIVVSAQEYKHQQAVKAMAEAAENRLDYAPAGGRYLLNGQLVDTDGKSIGDEKKASK